MQRKDRYSRVTLGLEHLEERSVLSTTGLADISPAQALDFAAIVRSVAIESKETSQQIGTIDLDHLDSLLSDRAIVDGERVYVSVHGNGSSESLLKFLESHGFERRVAASSEARFQGFLPVSALRDVASDNQVVSLVPFNDHILTNSVGSVSNNAEIALRGDVLTRFREEKGSERLSTIVAHCFNA
jgi:hypothetical protein